MLIYILAIGLIIGLFCLSKSRTAKNRALSASFAILWLIASLRHQSIGTDTPAYSDFFSAVSNGTIDVFSQINLPNIFLFEGFENGFQIYNYAISLITSDFTIYLLITYAFIYFSFYHFIKNNTTDPFLSTIIYITVFYFGSMSLLRQTFAMAILTWGFKYIQRRSFFKYLIIVLIATLVHQASIVMIVPYFMYRNKISLYNVITYILVGIVAFFAIEWLIYLLTDVNARYAFYIDRINSYSLGSILSFILYTITSFTLYHLYKRLQKTDTNKETLVQAAFLVKMTIIGAISSFIAIKVNALSRFALFFMIYILIAIPNLVHYKTFPMMKSYRLILIIVLLAYCFSILILRPEWLNVTHYQTIFGAT